MFKHIKTIEELKAAYKKAAMKNHPDRGGDTATMQKINTDYEDAFNKFKNTHNEDPSTRHKRTETHDMFITIINAIINLDLNIELCGVWLWISGDTKKYKVELKAAGCEWAPVKKVWYWRPEKFKSRTSRGKSTMGDIRNKFGSETINKSKSKKPEFIKE